MADKSTWWSDYYKNDTPPIEQVHRIRIRSEDKVLTEDLLKALCNALNCIRTLSEDYDELEPYIEGEELVQRILKPQKGK